jgi:hypothetical protein
MRTGMGARIGKASAELDVRDVAECITTNNQLYSKNHDRALVFPLSSCCPDLTENLAPRQIVKKSVTRCSCAKLLTSGYSCIQDASMR